MSGNGKYSTLRGRQWPQWPEFPGTDLAGAAPQVVAGQVDVLPAQRREVLQQRVVDWLTPKSMDRK